MNKYLPSATDTLILIGLIGIGTGISFEWSWPLGILVDGGIILSIAITAKLKGSP